MVIISSKIINYFIDAIASTTWSTEIFWNLFIQMLSTKIQPYICEKPLEVHDATLSWIKQCSSTFYHIYLVKCRTLNSSHIWIVAALRPCKCSINTVAII